MRKRFAIGAALFLCGALAFADTPDREALSAANAIAQRFADSWNHADGAANGKNYWPEAELVNPSGLIVSGKAAIVQEHVDLWAEPFKGSHVAGKVLRVQMLGANYMIVDFDVQLSGFAKAQPCAHRVDRLMHPLTQLRLDGVKRRPRPLGHSPDKCFPPLEAEFP